MNYVNTGITWKFAEDNVNFTEQPKTPFHLFLSQFRPRGLVPWQSGLTRTHSLSTSLRATFRSCSEMVAISKIKCVTCKAKRLPCI